MKHLLTAAALTVCALPAQALTLTSPAFADQGRIPNQFTYSLGNQCSGSNQSPPLVIGDVPAGTRSFALTVYDPDGGDWLHWKAWNIPATTTRLGENAAATASFNQANNDFGSAGYGGPCPPTPNHRYVFTLYALSSSFTSEPSTSQLQTAALATATLTGLRSPTDNLSWTAPSQQDCLFSWAEATYPGFFAPAAARNQTLGPFTLRHYAQSNAYLGISSENNHLYYLGPLSNHELLDLKAVADWYRTAGCQ